MRKTITEKWLRKLGACDDGIEWFKTKNTSNMIDILKSIHEEPSYAYWLLSRIELSKKQSVRAAIFSAELSLKNYKGPESSILIDSAAESAEAAGSADSALTAVKATVEAAYSAAYSAAESSAIPSVREAAKSAVWRKILAYVIEETQGREAIAENVHA